MENKLSVLLTGDVCFKYQHDVDLHKSKEILSDVIDEFRASDIRIMNLETPLAPATMGSPIRKSGPPIVGRPCNLGFLNEAGCDMAVLANNHTGDYGEDVLAYTVRLLDLYNIGHAGAGSNIEEAYKPWRCEKNGIRISVFAVCEHEFGFAGTDSAGTAAFDIERLATGMKAEREWADFVLVVSHGGNEHNPLPSPQMKKRLHTIIRLGADAIVAHHPHTMQGFEYFEGKPIVYSLGNFLFKYENMKVDLWFCGYMARLTFEKGKEVGVEVIPYCFRPDGSFIEKLKGERREAMLGYIDRISEILKDDALVEKYFDGWCMGAGLGYAKRINENPDYFDPDKQPADCAHLRNLFTCEAHRELLASTFRILFEGRMPEALEWYEKIKELQKMPIEVNK